ncbi:circadian clock-controlled protein [Clostridium butyricum]|uniref:circadian clock-controlled protein n=1 Tax=Clostridium butyricum TaxID=1492 RepID=UPI002AB18B7C|nr:circadian clock-controlled protein [Clostridium butyricum]
MARIDVSFKNTEKDNELYDFWNPMEDRSTEIKAVLRIEMEKRKANTNMKTELIERKNVDNKHQEVDILNF